MADTCKFKHKFSDSDQICLRPFHSAFRGSSVSMFPHATLGPCKLTDFGLEDSWPWPWPRPCCPRTHPWCI